MDKENININYSDYAEMMKDKAIKGEKFIRFEVVGCTDENADDEGLMYARIDGKHYSTIDLLKCLMSAQGLINKEIEKRPDLKFLWSFKDKLLSKQTYKIDKDKNGKENLKKEE